MKGELLVCQSLTAAQDARRSLVLQVYIGSNTLEFSAIRSLLLTTPEVEGLVIRILCYLSR